MIQETRSRTKEIADVGFENNHDDLMQQYPPKALAAGQSPCWRHCTCTVRRSYCTNRAWYRLQGAREEETPDIVNMGASDHADDAMTPSSTRGRTCWQRCTCTVRQSCSGNRTEYGLEKKNVEKWSLQWVRGRSGSRQTCIQRQLTCEARFQVLSEFIR